MASRYGNGVNDPAGKRQMLGEAAQAPSICARQIDANRAVMREVAGVLRRRAPKFVATLARGSSDHAASFAKFQIETRLGIPVLSHSPSTGSLYHATSPNFADAVLIAISQSGRSPDLLEAVRDAQRAGAIVVALVNDVGSPLAELADLPVPLRAGPELAVAATKSFLATLTAILHLVAELSENDALLNDLEAVEAPLDAAWQCDWSAAVAPLARTKNAMVLGRGPTLGTAAEAALKLKEVAGIHAEPFSFAEVAHGPMTLVGPDMPVLAFGPPDAAHEGLRERIADFAARDAIVIAAGESGDVGGASVILPQASAPAAIRPLAQILSFYRLVDEVARATGRDPDNPPYLSKVTKTL